jgi:hypothetical protein
MMARLVLLVGICLSTAGYYRCSWNGGGSGLVVGGGSGSGDGSSGSGSTTGATFGTTLILRDSAGVATTSFVMGEPIRFDFEVRNLTNHVVQLQFSDAQIDDFTVLDQASTRTLWQWSQGQAFPQVSTTLTFEPFATKSYSLLWNAALSDGSQLPVGSFFRARAMLVPDSSPTDPLAPAETISALVSFSVR